MANEKRLIDANALKRFVCEFCNSINSDEPCEPADCRCMSIIDQMPTVDAVEVARLGKLGRLMMTYRGCGRGRVGPSGCVGNFKPMELDPIEDIEGDRWVPVLEDDLSLLKAKANNAVEVVWMPVLGFEGLYEISNLGKVRNHKGETLKQGIKRTNCTCYKLVNLWKDGRYYKKYVHRLIAEAFIPNPNNLPMVNHKDEDGTNNSIDNLEWCTREYNVNYGTAKERRAKKIRGVKHTDEHNRKISESMKRHFAKMDGDGNADV